MYGESFSTSHIASRTRKTNGTLDAHVPNIRKQSGIKKLQSFVEFQLIHIWIAKSITYAHIRYTSVAQSEPYDTNTAQRKHKSVLFSASRSSTAVTHICAWRFFIAKQAFFAVHYTQRMNTIRKQRTTDNFSSNNSGLERHFISSLRLRWWNRGINSFANCISHKASRSIYTVNTHRSNRSQAIGGPCSN